MESDLKIGLCKLTLIENSITQLQITDEIDRSAALHKLLTLAERDYLEVFKMIEKGKLDLNEKENEISMLKIFLDGCENSKDSIRDRVIVFLHAEHRRGTNTDDLANVINELSGGW
jgi:hypothetical protein